MSNLYNKYLVLTGTEIDNMRGNIDWLTAPIPSINNKTLADIFGYKKVERMMSGSVNFPLYSERQSITNSGSADFGKFYLAVNETDIGQYFPQMTGSLVDFDSNWIS